MTHEQFDKFRAMFPDLSEAVLRANAPEGHPDYSQVAQSPGKAVESPVLRQRRAKGPSKLQLDWLERLKILYPKAQVLGEMLTITLANGVRYTPDAWTIETFKPEGSPYPWERWNAWEVKGPQFWEDARVKLKVAARVAPFITFYLVTRKGRCGPFEQLKIEP